MAHFVVSKHINGRDWNGTAELRGWQVNRSTKKEVLKKVRGKAQQLANETNETQVIDVYTGKGKLQRQEEIEPTGG